MEKKEYENISGVEIKIVSIEVKQNYKENEVVEKVVFRTDKGEEIGYKPKTQKKEWRKGLQLVVTKPCLFDDLPEMIFTIGQVVNNKGSALVKVSYNIWNTEKDGNPVSYRFVQGEKMFASWELVADKPIQEENIK